MSPVSPAELTLEQKAALVCGRDFWSTTPVESVGVPAVALVDGPHGLRYQDAAGDHLGINDSRPATCFPPAVAVGASWDPSVAARIGAAIGREARAFGVAVNLGPGVNIKRSPLCGRNFEYYAEDPLVSGVLAAAHVRALQNEGVGASVKHFAANNQETDRMRISADVDERTLREIYFPAFERVVTEARPATVMCSYNKINSTYAAENRWLLTEVLREEWGFDGAVVSDWGAVHDRVAALRAGLDLQMPGPGDPDDIVAAVRAGHLAESVLDEAVRRVLTVADQVTPATGEFDADAHHVLATKLAAECAVLVRNEHATLPITSDIRRIAVIGEFATAPRFQGGGSSHVNPTQVAIPLDAIRALAATYGQAVTHATGLADNAEALARRADLTIVFAGLAERFESEGYDRETIELPTEQVELIRAVAAASSRTVVVLSHGGVVSVEGWHDEVDAILDGFLLGQGGGAALADLLYGKICPSGHLAETVPLRLADTSSYLNFPGEQGHVRYGEGVMVGYRYHQTADVPVRYPFGHGLSYTTFATTGLTVTATGADTATASVTVTNTGDRTGKHVVQLYIATDTGPVRRPARELRAFTKLELAPGASRSVEFELDRRAFAYYDRELSRWVVAPGEYTIQIGHNARDIAAAQAITLTGDAIVRTLSLDSGVGDWFGHPVVGPIFTARLREGMPEEQVLDSERNADMLRMIASLPLRQFLGFLSTAGLNIPDTDIADMIALSGS